MRSPAEQVCLALVTAGWANFSAGDVAAPEGHAAAIDFSTEREQMGEVLLDAEIDPEYLTNFEEGWYVLLEKEQQVVIVGPVNEAEARARVRFVSYQHVAWEKAGELDAE